MPVLRMCWRKARKNSGRLHASDRLAGKTIAGHTQEMSQKYDFGKHGRRTEHIAGDAADLLSE